MKRNMKDEKNKKSVIFTHYKCNNNCRFCIQNHLRSKKARRTEEIKKEMISCKKREINYLELIGGEMTIRDDFIDLIKFADNLEFQTVMIATNGRMFAYPEYAEKAIEAGLSSIVFSIHGHNAELHDYLTRSEGSFDQLHRGLENIKKAAQKLGKSINLGSNTTIVKPNFKKLPEIGRHIKSLGIRNSEFIFVDCNEGGAYDNFEELVPKVSDTAPYIKECLDLVDVNKTGVNWDVRYVPLCYFIDYLDQVSEIREDLTFETTEHLTDDERRTYTYSENRKKVARVKTDKCKRCLVNNICEGVWKNYYNHFGDQDLKPITDTKNIKLCPE